jgi:hypothetical protein
MHSFPDPSWGIPTGSHPCQLDDVIAVVLAISYDNAEDRCTESVRANLGEALLESRRGMRLPLAPTRAFCERSVGTQSLLVRHRARTASDCIGSEEVQIQRVSKNLRRFRIGNGLLL